MKASVGGWVGRTQIHPDLLEAAVETLEDKDRSGLLVDFVATHAGDDLALVLTHREGAQSEIIQGIAHRAFEAAAKRAQSLKLHEAHLQFAMGAAELEFEERASEPIVVFLIDKADPGAFNLPLYRAFADPFNTPSLLADPTLAGGFRFEVADLAKRRRVLLDGEADTYRLLALLASPERFVVRRIFPKEGNPVPGDEAVAAVSIEAEGEGSFDPVAVCRAFGGLPTVGELLEPFAALQLVSGWRGNRFFGPLLPVALAKASSTRLEGPPRAVALGFTLAAGELVGPVDLFDDVAFDRAREKGLEVADHVRRNGLFVPHRESELRPESAVPDADWEALRK